MKATTENTVALNPCVEEEKTQELPGFASSSHCSVMEGDGRVHYPNRVDGKV